MHTFWIVICFAVATITMCVALYAFTEDDVVLAIIALLGCGLYIGLAIALITEQPPLQWTKARAKVEQTCSPYQVRNLHKADNSFVFSCAGDSQIRIVNVKR